MLQSVGALHPECDLFYLLVDGANDSISSEHGFETITLDRLRIPNLLSMTFVFDIVEMNTAVKPFFISYLFNKGYSKVIYLDPDIFVYERLDSAIQLLDTHSIVLTPHALHPAPMIKSFVNKIQWEQNMTLTGIFNLGFIGISKGKSKKEFLNWWENRCCYLCFREPAVGLFVDQKWAELAIAFWDDIYILRDVGYNVSLWNLHERKYNNGFINGSSKLIFFHFSSINIEDNSFLSNHDKTVTFKQFPELHELFSKYRHKILENEYSVYSSIPYAYDYFNDGISIDLLERKIYAMVADFYPNPFASSRREFYRRIKRNAKTHQLKQNKRNYTIAEIAASLLFKLIGAKKYRELMLLGNKTVQMRAHTYLLR